MVFLFSWASLEEKNREQVYTRNGSKRVKSAKDVLFGGFIKNGHPTLTSPKFQKIA